MRGFSRLSWLIGSLLQLMPLLGHAQAEMMSTGPMVPDPIPPPPKVVVPPPMAVPPPTVPPGAPPGAVPAAAPSSRMAPPNPLCKRKGLHLCSYGS